MKKLLFPVALLALISVTFGASAQPLYEGIAKPWQLNFQEPATPVMEKLNNIHDFLLVIITAITVLVLVGLIYICVRFRRKANPVPSKTTHNTKLEIIWTVIPIIILVVIAIPSLRAHYFMQKVVEPGLTLKVVGYQWYWHYEYPDQGGFGFDSYMKKDADLKPGEHRLLAVDNHVVVPVDTTVRVLLTGADVIHAWAIPAFGVKRDAIPGRLNESWFKATKIGRFYGQCSELCGVGHGFMPIVVDVVSKEDFAKWVKGKQQEAGINPADLAAKAEAKADAEKETPVVKPISAEEPVDSKEGTPPASKKEPAELNDDKKAEAQADKKEKEQAEDKAEDKSEEPAEKTAE